MSEQYVDLRKARNPQQEAVMENIKEQSICPFCPEHILEIHQKPILRSGEHWLVTENQWPYERTSIHLLAITAYHAESMSDLREGSFDELQQHVLWAEREYSIPSYALAMRLGDIASNGATVRHLHAHIISPTGEDPEKPVRFKIG